MAREHDAWIERVFGVRMSGAPAGPSEPDIFGAAGMGSLVAAGVAVHPAHAPVKPVPRAGLGPAQVNRARDLVLKMPPADKARVAALINKVQGEERPYLIKALASGHSAAEVVAFHARIAGKPHAWMENNLHLVGNTHGKGIKQQWETSCVPTMVEAMRGELDPVYALRTNEQNPNLTRADDNDGKHLNPKLAAEQKAELDDSMSMAVSRNMLVSDGGEDDPTAIRHLTAATGLRFKNKAVGFDQETVQRVLEELKSSPKLHRALDDIKSSTLAGFPVPVSVVQIGGQPGREYAFGGHMMLCTGYDPGPPPRYSIHDPWTGDTVVVTEDDLRRGDLHLTGMGVAVLAGYYQPEQFK